MIGLIGYGRFGRLAAVLLSKRAVVVVADRTRPRLRGKGRNIRVGTIREAASQPVVVLAVPVGRLQALLKEIRGFVQERALIIDVCAVKAVPTRWMKAILPRGVDILGTHPLFGPDSCKSGLEDHTVVLCPVRIGRRRLAEVQKALTDANARVRLMRPATHDKMIAETIFLTQYIGRLVGSARLGRWKGVTIHYDRLLTVVEAAVHDSPALFRDMWKFNAHGARVGGALRQAHARILRQLEEAN